MCSYYPLEQGTTLGPRDTKRHFCQGAHKPGEETGIQGEMVLKVFQIIAVHLVALVIGILREV